MAAYRYTRRRARSQRGREAQGGGAGRVILGLLAVAALLYFITASAAGSWISENIVNPVLEAFNPEPATSVADTAWLEPTGAGGGTGDIYADADETLSAQDSVTATPNAAPITGTDLKLDGALIHAVQMGAFKSEANAGTEADTVRGRGGAGYVYYDGELYRVLASAYATEPEAKAVRDQLKSEAIEAGVFTMEIEEVNLHVTAGENVVAAMTGAMDAVKAARDELTALSIAYDKKEITASAAKSSIDETNASLRAALNELSAQAGSDNAVISRLAALLEKMSAGLDELSSAGNELDFSSRMKYTQIGMVSDTVEFVNAITK